MKNLTDDEFINNYNKKEDTTPKIEDVEAILFKGDFSILKELDPSFIEENYETIIFAIKCSNSNYSLKKDAYDLIKELLHSGKTI